jgi:DNA-binding Lrp family transcriptional regulator
MDDLDRKLLSRLQTDFPLEGRPFAVLARELGTDELSVMERVRRLWDAGYIRRIGPVIDIRRAGGASVLAAVAAPPERLEEVGRLVGEFEGVSHCYHREGRNVPLPFNLWFTVSAGSNAELAERLGAISARIGLPVRSLPMRRQFKINVRFRLDD